MHKRTLVVGILCDAMVSPALAQPSAEPGAVGEPAAQEEAMQRFK